LPNLSTISISWDTKRKLEKIKFDLETKLKRKLTWDEFFNSIELNISKNARGRSGD
jgi:hypothetical protein